MDDKIVVESGGLRQVASKLADNSKQLNTLYTNDIISVLNACQEELKVSGLDYDNVYDSFKKMFTGLHSQLEALVDAMNNIIIPEYELTAQAISTMFNSEFASEMSGYLKQMSAD